MKTRKLIIGLIIPILITLVTGQMALSKSLGKYVFAPVYYVTDRIPEKRNGIVTFKNEEQAINKSTSGIQYAVVPVRSDIVDTWTTYAASDGLVLVKIREDKGLPDGAFNDPAKYDRAIKSLSKVEESDGETIGAVKKTDSDGRQIKFITRRGGKFMCMDSIMTSTRQLQRVQSYHPGSKNGLCLLVDDEVSSTTDTNSD